MGDPAEESDLIGRPGPTTGEHDRETVPMRFYVGRNTWSPICQAHDTSSISNGLPTPWRAGFSFIPSMGGGRAGARDQNDANRDDARRHCRICPTLIPRSHLTPPPLGMNCRPRYDSEVRIAVVGGGINGSGVTWELARKGYDVTLFEKGICGAQTSPATTKLIHGGVRHLQGVHLALVRESLREPA